MYINVYGEVFDCPASNYRIGSIKEETLKTLWDRNTQRKIYHGVMNNYCPYRVKSGALPKNLKPEVEKYLRQML